MDAKRPTPRHIIIKMLKVKDKGRILKAAREKKLVTYRGIPIRLSADFSKWILQVRRYWQEIFEVMKSKDPQPRLLYPAKLSFRIEGQVRASQARKNLKSLSYHIIWNVKGTYLRRRRSKLWIIKWQQMCIYQKLNQTKNQTKQTRTETESWIWRVFW